MILSSIIIHTWLLSILSIFSSCIGVDPLLRSLRTPLDTYLTYPALRKERQGEEERKKKGAEWHPLSIVFVMPRYVISFHRKGGFQLSNPIRLVLGVSQSLHGKPCHPGSSSDRVGRGTMPQVARLISFSLPNRPGDRVPAASNNLYGPPKFRAGV